MPTGPEHFGEGNLGEVQEGEKEKLKSEQPETKGKESPEVEAPTFFGTWVEQSVERRMETMYGKETDFSPETQKYFDDYFQKEIDNAIISFLIQWFEDNKEELEKSGIDVNVTNEKKAEIAWEKGAREDLARNEKYQDQKEQLENLYALKIDLRKRSVPIESLYLTLNLLQKKAEVLENEIEQMKKNNEPSYKIESKEKEREQLFRVRQELAEKVTGWNFRKEAEKEIDPQCTPKEEYIESNLEEAQSDEKKEVKKKLFDKEWEALSEEEKKQKFNNDQLQFADAKLSEESVKEYLGVKLKPEDVLALREMGYNPGEFKVVGIFRRRIEVREGVRLTAKEFTNFLNTQREGFEKSIEDKARQKLGEKWERERERRIREAIEQRIREAATSPEKAIEGIEGMYKKRKEELIAEWLDQRGKKKEKTPQEKKEIAREFDQPGQNPVELLEGARDLRNTLNGNLHQDMEALMGLLENYGFEASPEEIA